MIKTETRLFCDCCKKEITEVYNSCELNLTMLKYDVRYGGIYVIKDICNDCNNKLFEFLVNNNMIQYVREK